MNIGELIAHLGIDTVDVKMAERDMKRFEKSASNSMRKVNQSVGVAEKGMRRMGGVVAGLFAAHRLYRGASKFIEMNAKFGQSLADLSAITGAVGQDLEFYEQQARAIGAATTLSASQAAKAFELMGSARPELLKNKEALAAVTQEAVTLAEAAGLDLPTATQALAKAMNQFSIPAHEASRVINVLAAGSKEGAEAIPGLAEAIRWMGTSAAMANISLEESVGMIETLAEMGLSGSESGAQLRNVILKLQTQADRFNPKIVGMTQALRNLNRENLSAADLVQMFGLRNQQAGAILIENVDKLEAYTKAVTGTNVAYEQQAKRVDTVQGKWKQLMAVIESIILQGTGFRERMKQAIDYMILWIPKAADRFYTIRNAIVSVINYFIDLYNEAVAFRAVIQGVVFAVKTAFGFVKLQVQSVVDSFKGLGRIVKDVFTGNWEAIREHADETGQQIADRWTEYTQQVAENWEKMLNSVTTKPHIQVIDIVYRTSGSSAVAPVTAPETKTKSFQGKSIPYTLPTGIERAVPQIDALNVAMDRADEKQREFANATLMSVAAFDLFAGMSNVISDALQSTESTLKAFTKFFGDFIKGMIMRMIAATLAALALAAALTAITGGAKGGGSFGATMLNALGLKKGASFGDMFGAGLGKFMMGMAEGGIVPPGYPNDSYPALLSSNEVVTPPGKLPAGNMTIIVEPEIIEIPNDKIYIGFKAYERERNGIRT